MAVPDPFEAGVNLWTASHAMARAAPQGAKREGAIVLVEGRRRPAWSRASLSSHPQVSDPDLSLFTSLPRAALFAAGGHWQGRSPAGGLACPRTFLLLISVLPPAQT